MKLRIGLKEGLEHGALAKRLTNLTLLRLLFLSVFLGISGRWYLHNVEWNSFSVQLALLALGCGFALAAIYAAVLRAGWRLRELAYVQLAFDQLTWTTLVYVSGGATSGATSLYGLTTLTGAMLEGLPGAAYAAAIGYLCYASLCLLMAFGAVSPPPDQTNVPYADSLVQVIYPLGLNLLVLVVVTLLGGYLAERLRLAGGKIAEANERANRAEHLAQLGTLAAGLAHEIRNPLGSIAASIELLRETPAFTDDDKKLCDIIRAETSRLNDLVDDMLNLARPRSPELCPTDLTTVAREVVQLAAKFGRSASDVSVVYDGPASPVMVQADSRQLRQVIWNLARNGVQSTAPRTEVTVRVDRQDRRAIVEVIDCGPGIPPEARQHIFDAFFTTRSHGAGIGLAVVKRIVDDHGWAIETLNVEAGPARTVFRVIIPGSATPSLAPPAD